MKKFLEDKELIDCNNVFVVAFSGGFDSMALADILIKLSHIYGFKVVLAHLNHNWRGEISDKEAKNCENFAKENSVDFYTETLPHDIPHTETVAREERYKFFKRVAQKYKTDKIFTAHTQSDNIETVFQRIIKGTGISGLCGINEIRILDNTKVYRPLLNCSRADILHYCKVNKLSPNDDNSNKDTRYFRNKIRENLIPQLKSEYDKNIEAAIVRLIQNANEQECMLNELLEPILEKVYDDEDINTREFLKLSNPIKLRIIRDFLKKNDFDYDKKRILEVLDFIETNSKSKSGKTLSLAENRWLFANDIIVELLDEKSYNTSFEQKTLNMNGETFLDEFNAVLKVTKWDGAVPDKFPADTENVIYADFSNVTMPITFRTRLFGDVITPFGKHTPIKLKKYLNNKKLSKHAKSKVLLIASGQEVLWVINLGISNNIRVINMPTHKVEFYIRSEHE